MGTSRKINKSRNCRNPRVVIFQNDIPVNSDLMSGTDSLLSNTNKNRVSPFFIYFDIPLVQLPLRNNPSIWCYNRFGRNILIRIDSIDSFTRVEICPSVIMPKDSIAFAGNYNRRYNLRIILSESSGQAENIKLAILELTSAKLVVPWLHYIRL